MDDKLMDELEAQANELCKEKGYDNVVCYYSTEDYIAFFGFENSWGEQPFPRQDFIIGTKNGVHWATKKEVKALPTLCI